eukprot:4790166-Pleurochrysis_carterae.AAC.1
MAVYLLRVLRKSLYSSSERVKKLAMNRPENRLDSERFALFSRSRVGFNEGLSYSTWQTKENELTMAVSCRESCLTAL